ncbi:MAG TPA: hypothetical protein VKH44_14270, partial [Pirellulaceae bacterium]|nr:hypothetical protein [Pirellulaceae bacterium]
SSWEQGVKEKQAKCLAILAQFSDLTKSTKTTRGTENGEEGTENEKRGRFCFSFSVLCSPFLQPVSAARETY